MSMKNMKRIKPAKNILLKRIHIKEQTFDFIFENEITAKNIIESTKNNVKGSKYEKAGIYYSALIRFKIGLKSGWIRDLTLIIITILLSIFIPKIFN